MAASRIAVPTSFFGIVLGLVGLGDCWRAASRAWGLPQAVSEVVMACAFGIWLLLLALYVGKWVWARDEALAELRHPVQSCFVGLVGVATLLAAVAIAPDAPSLAWILFVVGALLQGGYGLLFVGRQWQGEREPTTATPALYLPTVAGNFVTSFVAGYFGYVDVGTLFFGAGLLSWLALESLLLHRLSFLPMPPPLRPTLGIMLAPPVVGCVGYLFLTGGLAGAKPDLFAQLLLGYGLLLLLLLVRLLPWILKQPFGASYWAFSFGVTALAFDAIVFVVRGQTGYIEWMSMVLFVFANAVIALLVAGTLWRLFRGELLPPPLIGMK